MSPRHPPRSTASRRLRFALGIGFVAMTAACSSMPVANRRTPAAVPQGTPVTTAPAPAAIPRSQRLAVLLDSQRARSGPSETSVQVGLVEALRPITESEPSFQFSVEWSEPTGSSGSTSCFRGVQTGIPDGLPTRDDTFEHAMAHRG